MSNSENKYKWIMQLAEAVDAWRIFPRAFITVYLYLLFTTVHWFMALEDPSMPQSGLISVIVGAGAAWFGLYVNSGRKEPIQINSFTSTETSEGIRGPSSRTQSEHISR